jgi:hypothetical protein
MSRIRVVAIAALTVAVGVGGVALAAKKKQRKGKKEGRVVRVERSSAGRNLVPRLCNQVSMDGTISCWGMTVEVGEVAQVYDETGHKADLRVDTAMPQMDNCQNTVGWTLGTTAVHGAVPQTYNYNMYAVFDWRGTDQTRVVINNGQMMPPPGSRAGESVLGGIDDNLDDVPDLLVTYYQCDASGNPASYGSGAYCLVYYRHDTGSSYTELRVDIVRSCY